MSARDDILSRVRAALTDIGTLPQPRAELLAEPPAMSADAVARTTTSADAKEGSRVMLELFVENVADYRATVIRAKEGDVAATIVAALRSAGLESLVVPTGLDASWQQALGEAFEVHSESEADSAATLDAISAVVTGSALGIASTGTIILDHRGDQGRRELTLVPDTHVCVIRDDQVVPDVPEAVTRLGAAPHKGQPLTWISGPSATSDIELQRVEGVHGPRTLVVVLVESGD
ncbi:MAG: lactate utilization protein C [Knoellia sp.]